MKHAQMLMVAALSLVAGLVAIVFAARWLDHQGNLAVVRVAVAASDLGLGQKIGAEQVKLIEWPRASVPAGAFHDAQSLSARVTRLNIARDEPILEHKLAAVGATGGLAAVISTGKRAITVRVNDVVGVAGFALPGSYVDVILSTRTDHNGNEGNDGPTIAKIVLENILVLAAGDEAARDDTRPRPVKAVTLEVTPSQAEAIDLARSVGQLSLVLRNQVDNATAQTAGMTKAVLLGRTVPEVQPVIKVPKPSTGPAVSECVDFFNGRERTKQCF